MKNDQNTSFLHSMANLTLDYLEVKNKGRYELVVISAAQDGMDDNVHFISTLDAVNLKDLLQHVIKKLEDHQNENLHNDSRPDGASRNN